MWCCKSFSLWQGIAIFSLGSLNILCIRHFWALSVKIRNSPNFFNLYNSSSNIKYQEHKSKSVKAISALHITCCCKRASCRLSFRSSSRMVSILECHSATFCAPLPSLSVRMSSCRPECCNSSAASLSCTSCLSSFTCVNMSRVILFKKIQLISLFFFIYTSLWWYV